MEPFTFAEYLLLERLDKGDRSNIYAAIAQEGGTAGLLCALKRFLCTESASELEFLRTVLEEARLFTQLSHPNLVRVLRLGESQGCYFAAMEYVAGVSLAQLVQRWQRPLPPSLAAFVAVQLCHGLEYLHDARDASGQPLRIVHGDIIPHNALLTFDGQVKLAGLGIAHGIERSEHVYADVMAKRIGYLSPEQVRGLPFDRRADVFSLGVLLFELLCGQRLFLGKSDFATLELVRDCCIPAPRQLNAAISREFEAVLLTALAQDAAQRYATAQQLATALQPFVADAGPGVLATFVKDACQAEADVEAARWEIFAAHGLRPEAQQTLAP